MFNAVTRTSPFIRFQQAALRFTAAVPATQPGTVKTIAHVFGEGTSTISFLGRNDTLIGGGLAALPMPVNNILLMASGPFEPWTVSGQPLVRKQPHPPTITALDLSPDITTLNRQLLETGRVAKQALSHAIVNPVHGNIPNILPPHAQKGLSQKGIEGVRVSHDTLHVAPENRQRVRIEPPTNALTFVQKAHGHLFEFIFSGNLENNLLFQPGYTLEAAVQFHRNIARQLSPQGIYAFTTNDLFFNCQDSHTPKNTLRTLDSAGLDVLFKVSASAKALLDQTKQTAYILENCDLLTARRGDYLQLPQAHQVVIGIRNKLAQHLPGMTILEGQGSLKAFQNTLSQTAQPQTNLALVKTGQDTYQWFNLPDSYEETFRRLTQGQGHFSPHLSELLLLAPA